MIKKIKSIIKKNKVYKFLKFIKNIPPKDYLDFEKLLLAIKIFPFTMSSYQRVSNAYELAKLAEREKLEGSFVECGVWKGGVSAVMAYVAQKFESDRKVWLFDSFEGLPEPTKEDGQIAKEYSFGRDSGNLKTIKQCVSTEEDVRKVFFEVLKLNPGGICIKKGWFQNILPKERQNVGKIAILRLDGDWYESTKVCLENMYDNVIIGGYIIIDDYSHWEGAKKAVHDFFSERKINPQLIKIDYAGVYFKKI